MPQTGNADYRANEFLPLDHLLEISEARLGDALERSRSLLLYKNANSKSKTSSAMAGLKLRPYISRADLIENSAVSVGQMSGGRHVQLWGSSGIGGSSCWFPRGRADVSRCLDLSGRIISVSGIQSGDVILVLSQAGNGATNMLPYALAGALKNSAIPAQVIPANMGLDLHVRKGADFLVANPPSVMIAEPGNALELARIMSSMNGQPALPGMRFILLCSAAAAGQVGALKQAYSAGIRLSIGLDGLDIFGLECANGGGVHLWLDTGLYEIIPDSELSRETAEIGYIPQASWLWEASEAIRGELVITNFNEVMPLIRYRTGYRVESAGSGKCECGRVHPRVKLL